MNAHTEDDFQAALRHPAFADLVGKLAHHGVGDDISQRIAVAIQQATEMLGEHPDLMLCSGGAVQ